MLEALAVIPELNALTISLMSDVLEPVHWDWVPEERAGVHDAVDGGNEERVRRHVVDEHQLPRCDLMKLSSAASASVTAPIDGVAMN